MTRRKSEDDGPPATMAAALAAIPPPNENDLAKIGGALFEWAQAVQLGAPDADAKLTLAKTAALFLACRGVESAEIQKTG